MGRTSDSRSSTSRADRRADEAPAATTADDQRVEVGRVVGAHGLRGQLRVAAHDPASAPPEAGESVVLVSREGFAREFEVGRVTPGRAGEWRVALVGLRQRDAAEALRGHRLERRADRLERLAEGEWYAYQLVGCRLEAEDGRALGQIRGIWETGGSDVLVVAGEGGRELLVPAALLRGVDPQARRAVVELLPGLLEDD